MTDGGNRPMRVLVVYAHPVAESFNAAIHRAVFKALAEAGHDVVDTDLYAQGFEPALSADERRLYHTPGQNTGTVADHVAELRRAEALVLVFPTWWYGMPAILKGYFDRVWSPGVAFTLPDGGGPIRPALTQIRKFAVVTTTGAPWWFIRLYMRDPCRKVILRGLKTLCAPAAEHVWLCHYGMDASTPESRATFLAKVRRTFAAF